MTIAFCISDRSRRNGSRHFPVIHRIDRIRDRIGIRAARIVGHRLVVCVRSGLAGPSSRRAPVLRSRIGKFPIGPLRHIDDILGPLRHIANVSKLLSLARRGPWTNGREFQVTVNAAVRAARERASRCIGNRIAGQSLRVRDRNRRQNRLAGHHLASNAAHQPAEFKNTCHWPARSGTSTTTETAARRRALRAHNQRHTRQQHCPHTHPKHCFSHGLTSCKTSCKPTPCPHPSTESTSLRAASHPPLPKHPQESNLHPEFRRPGSQAAPRKPSSIGRARPCPDRPP